MYAHTQDYVWSYIAYQNYNYALRVMLKREKDDEQ